MTARRVGVWRDGKPAQGDITEPREVVEKAGAERDGRLVLRTHGLGCSGTP